jgi:two-component system chemotaxis response regulator CheY
MENPLAGLRVMVVDDDRAVHSLLTEVLRFWGCGIVEVAETGREGVEKYSGLRPQLVIMDISMPVMNGYDACRAIKAIDPGAPIIVITGVPDGGLARKTLEQGLAKVVLPKPFRFDQLRVAIGEALRGTEAAMGLSGEAGAVA